MTTALLRRAKRIPLAERHHFIGFCDRCDQLGLVRFDDGLCQPCRHGGAR